jgi:hypothetical protein
MFLSLTTWAGSYMKQGSPASLDPTSLRQFEN